MLFRSGWSRVRVYPGGAGWSPERRKHRRRGSAVDGGDAPMVLVLRKDNHGVRLHAAKQVVAVVRSMASWSGHWRRPESGVAPASTGQGSRRRCAAKKIRERHERVRLCEGRRRRPNGGIGDLPWRRVRPRNGGGGGQLRRAILPIWRRKSKRLHRGSSEEVAGFI